MGKTNAQRQREWRERQKLHNLEKYRKKELERVNNYKAGKNQTEFKRKHRDATKRWRENKKAVEQATPTANNQTPASPAMQTQSLGKAVKRVRNVLPGSPRNKKIVVRKLAESMGLLSKQQSRRNTALSEELVETVKQFYRRDDIARHMPGKQDVLTIRDESGKRKEQKRILTMTVGEVFRLFKEEYPDLAIGKSKFAECRPSEVLLSSSMPRNVCNCQYHSNMFLILECLHNQLLHLFPLYCEQFMQDCVCNLNNKQCMSSNCELCKTKFEQVFINEIPMNMTNIPTTWHFWEKNDNDQLEKKTKSGTLNDAVSVLESILSKFKFHFYIKRNQSRAYNDAKENACKEESETAMIQMDFAENFKCIYQDEVASAHWKSSSVTLYTVMIWFRDHSVPMVIASDNSNHDKTTVVPYSFTVFKHVNELFGEQVKSITVWTDGPSSQFKNKFMFSYIGQNLPQLFPHYRIDWNYSATSHGKGAVDGLGGTIKRMATRAVTSRQAIIKGAETLVEAVSSKTRITLLFLSQEKISLLLGITGAEKDWENVLGIPGTMHVHHVEPHKDGIITKVITNDDSFTVHSLTNHVTQPHKIDTAPARYEIGDYVIVKYDDTFFLGEILDVLEGCAKVKVMMPSGPRYWKWPDREDSLMYPWANVIKKIGPLVVVSHRGMYEVNEMNFV